MSRTLIGIASGTMALGVVMMLASPAWADGAVGTWNIEIAVGDANLQNKLVIGKDMKGKMVSDDGEVELRELKFEDGTLSFEATVPFQGEELEVEFEGEIDGDELQGTFVTDIGEAVVTGSRGAAVTAAGSWDIKVEAGDIELRFELIIGKDMKGKLVTDDGEGELREVKFEDDALSFEVSIPFGGDELESSFEGEIDGDELQGAFYTDIGIATATGSRGAAATVVGTWDIEIAAGAANLQNKLVIGKDMKGKMVTDEGEVELRELTFDDGTLSFEATVPFGDDELEVEFKGEIDGDELQGTFFTEIGDAAVTGSRGAAATAVGTWDIEIAVGDANLQNKLVIGKDMKGKMVSDEGEVELREVTFEDGTLSFEATVPFQGEELEVEFQGEIDGDELQGTFVTDIGEAAVTGSRGAAVTAVGTWDIEIAVGDANLQNKLVIGKDMKGKLVSDEGEIELREVTFDDGTLSFEATVPFEGEELEVEFKGEIDGDELHGTFVADIGEAVVTGSRDK